MSRRTLAAVLGLALLTATSCAPISRSLVPAEASGPFVAGYHAYWTGDAWRDYPFDVLDELYFFETEAGPDGALLERRGWPEEWSEMRDRALAEGVQVVPTVSMHDPEGFQRLFSDSVRIERLVQSTVGLLVSDSALAGVHLDFEVFQPVSDAVRDGFTAYVAALAHELDLRFPGKSLSAFTLAFDDDDVYDEEALGLLVDFMVIQGYDYHSAGSENAGPVGATTGWGRLNWETVVARFDGFGVPRRKLVMAVPLYGYEWPVLSDAPGAETRGEGRTVPYTASAELLAGEADAVARGREHGVRRDPASGVPWYTFETADGWVQGWFDDAESLRAKYAFVRDLGLGGIALFPMAYGDDTLWSDLRRALR